MLCYHHVYTCRYQIDTFSTRLLNIERIVNLEWRGNGYEMPIGSLQHTIILDYNQKHVYFELSLVLRITRDFNRHNNKTIQQYNNTTIQQNNKTIQKKQQIWNYKTRRQQFKHTNHQGRAISNPGRNTSFTKRSPFEDAGVRGKQGPVSCFHPWHHKVAKTTAGNLIID